MKEKTFVRLMAVVIIAGVLSTTALVVYTVQLRRNCSIITYIANE